ncbi:hypothetical protein ABZ860_10990 [Microbispora sp. NPDC046973]|uniref:calcium-binding protein n=1 Tax=Microbispora sp. NPDC046973 TaxID=3155022 RepID=UPI0033D0F793
MTSHPFARRRLLVAPAAVLTLAFPLAGAAAADPAYVGTCTVSQTTLVYTAAPGVANEVTVQAPGLAGYSLAVQDEAGPIKGCSPDPRNGEAVLVGNVIKKIKVVAGDEDDVVVIAADINVPLPSVVYGGAGDDELRGGRGRDDLRGGDGDDDLRGGDGNDRLRGEAGDDVVRGGNDDDTLDGGKGADDLSGNAGNDEVDGGAGDDELRGGAGDDELNGGAGADDLSGNAGNDELNGGSGGDGLNGGAGTDDCNGGPGTDTTTACE